MADDDLIGTAWSNQELDLIVADYFDMLTAELRSESYVKAKHRQALMEVVKRTKRSVEFKHMNISAVLRELGLPWIKGYTPKANYQAAIFDAIDRYLSSHGTLLVLSNRPSLEMGEGPVPFLVQCPSKQPLRLRPSGLERLVRKFDPAERDFRNRSLGHAGEEMIFSFEKQRLMEAGRADLARKVRWVSAEDGDGAGYDILSFEVSGAERLLEVKTTNGHDTTPFFLTRVERDLSVERPESFLVARLYDFQRSPCLFEVRPPLDQFVHLTASNYQATFR